MKKSAKQSTTTEDGKSHYLHPKQWRLKWCHAISDITTLTRSAPMPLHPPQQVTAADIIQQGAFTETTAAFHSYKQTSSIIDLPLYHSISASSSFSSSPSPVHLSLGCTVGSDYCRSIVGERKREESERQRRRGEAGSGGHAPSPQWDQGTAKKPAFMTITPRVGPKNTQTYLKPRSFTHKHIMASHVTG